MREKFKVQCSMFNVLVSIFLLFTIHYSLFTLYGCSSQKEKVYRKNTILMDTLVTITVVSNSKDSAEKAIDSAFFEIEKLEKLFNFFSSDSEISLINKNAGIFEVSVSPDTLDIIDKALYISEKTEGAFDATIGAVITLYDFYKKVKPEDGAIKKNLPLVNYKYVTIDKNKLTVFLKKKGMLIDLGGISKGYAADKAVDTLKRKGIHSGLVSVAGDIRAFGLKPDGMPWKIGIRNPRAKGQKDDILATLELRDMAISTSGDYERYFIHDVKRYHHLINPGTGYPAEGCQSVSVITTEGALTDAFATGIFILGPEKGIKTLEKMGFDGIIVDSQGKVHITSHIRGKVEFKRSS
ncbi:MAG: FAD:protein FMN transferase [Nitrospirota bacterium]|nr:FAD:protein FMN transferase [Nitrospirota bacterium]MDH5767780.1 FAD:protein FMN transferase [Nitrospirota bacterium]